LRRLTGFLRWLTPGERLCRVGLRQQSSGFRRFRARLDRDGVDEVVCGNQPPSFARNSRGEINAGLTQWRTAVLRQQTRDRALACADAGRERLLGLVVQPKVFL